jgi:hypothetical protein
VGWGGVGWGEVGWGGAGVGWGGVGRDGGATQKGTPGGQESPRKVTVQRGAAVTFTFAVNCRVDGKLRALDQAEDDGIFLADEGVPYVGQREHVVHGVAPVQGWVLQGGWGYFRHLENCRGERVNIQPVITAYRIIYAVALRYVMMYHRHRRNRRRRPPFFF